MAVSFGTKADTTLGAGTSVSIAIPSDAVAGQLGIIVGVINASQTSITGWGDWAPVDTGWGLISTNSAVHFVMTKIIESGDIGSTVTVSFQNSGKVNATCVTYNNTQLGDGRAYTPNTTAVNTASCPSVTTVRDNAWIFRATTGKDGATTVITNPADTTQRTQVIGSGAGRALLSVVDDATAHDSGYASGTASFTYQTTSANYVGFTVALAPSTPSLTPETKTQDAVWNALYRTDTRADALWAQREAESLLSAGEWDVAARQSLTGDTSWNAHSREGLTESAQYGLGGPQRLAREADWAIRQLPPPGDPGPLRAVYTTPPSRWQYYAMRVPSREWLDRDLELSNVAIEEALSGPGTFSATLDHPYHKYIAEDGYPIIDPWSTLIIAEKDGQIRGGGIVTEVDPNGEALTITCMGFSGYLTGQPLEKTLSYGGNNATGKDANGPTSGKGADPVQITKDAWAQIQGMFPNANLGVGFTGDSSSKYRFATWKNVPNWFDYTPGAATTMEVTVPDNVDTPTQTTLVTVDVSGTTFSKKRQKVTGSKKPGKLESAAADDLAHPIYWQWYVYYYDNPDIGSMIDNYAQTTPFDYTEEWAWADDDKTDVVMNINIGSPRLGTTSQLVFIEGDNVTGVVPVVRGGEDYANGVVMIGSGDGAKQLRSSVSVSDGRLRHVSVQTDASITNSTMLKSTANSYLSSLQGVDDVQSFILMDHPNAPFGGFKVGDDIILQFGFGWMAGKTIKLRVTAIDYSPGDQRMTVSTKRSDSFRYAAAASE